MTKLIKRIITRGFDENLNMDNEAVEHIFEFDDGTNINVSKMNAIEIARYAYENRNQDGFRILNHVKSNQKIETYSTLLSVYLMLDLLKSKNQNNNQQQILYIIEKLGGKELLDNLRTEAEIKSKLDNQEIAWTDVLLEKVEIELNLNKI